LVNKTPQAFSEQTVKERVTQAYRAEVAAVIPHSEELLTLASGGIFVLRYPDHPVTKRLEQLAEKLLE
jgi:MinD-like ATPase involved in chromosome partitioning or flagellar assembly